MKKEDFNEVIRNNVKESGYHITIVSSLTLPRFAYSIGLSEEFYFELIFAGGVQFMKDELVAIFEEIVAALRLTDMDVGLILRTKNHGNFGFSPVHESWSQSLMLGVYDYYEKGSIKAVQIIPDLNHRTLDIPDLSKSFNASAEPIWRWLQEKWNYNVPQNSMVTTNLPALKGEIVTEISRWENDSWEMFAGAGPDVEEKDSRVVSLGTMLGIDFTIFPAIDIPIGKGLWRTDKELDWNQWG